ncbi:hypothetical protein AB4874_04825 [Thioclava sp. 15-R06ZXC-3]|uniref:Uncharacterized protein n=2 Tax=Thioclava arctica TaxID=3238301 RepID=A0ABV3THI2_9RHOB
MVEIQLRTRAQHAWATALEIADLVSGTRTKFEFGENDRGKLFAVSSEIIAREEENMRNAFCDIGTPELIEEFKHLEQRLGVISMLKTLREFDGSNRLKKHNVLNIYDDNGHPTLEVIPFSNAQAALERANELEADDKSYNAVYVTADNPNQLRSAYRNYFNDPVAFVELLESSIEKAEG